MAASEIRMRDKADLASNELGKDDTLSNKTMDKSQGKKHTNYLQRAARRSKAGFEKVHLELMRKYNSTEVNGKLAVRRASFRTSKRRHKERKHSDSTLIPECSTFKSYITESEDGYRSDTTVFDTAETSSLEQSTTLPSTARKYKSTEALNTVHKDNSPVKQLTGGSKLSKVAMIRTLHARKPPGNEQDSNDSSKASIARKDINTNTAVAYTDQIYDIPPPTSGKTTYTTDKTSDSATEGLYMPMDGSSIETVPDDETGDYMNCGDIDLVPPSKKAGPLNEITPLPMPRKKRQAPKAPSKNDVMKTEMKHNNVVVNSGDVSITANKTKTHVVGDNDNTTTADESAKISSVCDNTTAESDSSHIPGTNSINQTTIAQNGDYDTPPQTDSNTETTEERVEEIAEDMYIAMDSSSEDILTSEDGDYINCNEMDLVAHMKCQKSSKGELQGIATNRNNGKKNTNKDSRYGPMPGNITNTIKNTSVSVVSDNKKKNVCGNITSSNRVAKSKGSNAGENAKFPNTSRNAKTTDADEEQSPLYDTPPPTDRTTVDVDKRDETSVEDWYVPMDNDLLDNEAGDYTNVKELQHLKITGGSVDIYYSTEADSQDVARAVVNKANKKKCIDKIEETLNEDVRDYDYIDCDAVDLVPPPKGHKPAKIPSQRNTISCFPTQEAKKWTQAASGRSDVSKSANEADYSASFRSPDSEPEFYSYSVEEVVDVLGRCALSHLASICKEERLDGDFFRGVDKEDLCKEPFIMNWFYIGKFFRVVNGWRPKRIAKNMK